MQVTLSPNPASRSRRSVRVGSVTIGGGHPIAVQSMCSTKTTDVDATVEQAERLMTAGAAIVRVAVDGQKDVQALEKIRDRTRANLAVDLQENWALAAKVAPFVDKIRYNPGHLYHTDTNKTVRDKVAFLVDVATRYDLALRVGVNCGSIDPRELVQHSGDRIGAAVQSAVEHSALLDALGFHRYVVSIKDSDPAHVVSANLQFAKQMPTVPLHLGVTEAGLPPQGVTKARFAFEQLLRRGVGDTIRFSLTLPSDDKQREITEALSLLRDLATGATATPSARETKLNIISCPSCSRVESDLFVSLAEKVRALTRYAEGHAITIAVMGCRVNGPGETDDADLGLWCGPTKVNLKRGTEALGAFGYNEVLDQLKLEVDKLIDRRQRA